jgi:hypothetical protein
MSCGNQPTSQRADTALKIRIDSANADRVRQLPVLSSDEENYDGRIDN